MNDAEIALRAAINVLRDTIESKRMPSGHLLTADAADLHERAARYLEELVTTQSDEEMVLRVLRGMSDKRRLSLWMEHFCPHCGGERTVPWDTCYCTADE